MQTDALQRAIELAIKGGWINWEMQTRMTKYDIEAKTYSEAKAHQDLKMDYVEAIAISDPVFWQSLGKSLGWKESVPYIQIWSKYDNCIDDTEYDVEKFKQKSPEIWEKIKEGGTFEADNMVAEFCSLPPEYKTKWHRFIDNLAEGKDADSFFEALLANEK